MIGRGCGCGIAALISGIQRNQAEVKAPRFMAMPQDAVAASQRGLGLTRSHFPEGLVWTQKIPSFGLLLRIRIKTKVNRALA
jgi:hypothetical protein